MSHKLAENRLLWYVSLRSWLSGKVQLELQVCEITHFHVITTAVFILTMLILITQREWFPDTSQGKDQLYWIQPLQYILYFTDGPPHINKDSQTCFQFCQVNIFPLRLFCSFTAATTHISKDPQTCFQFCQVNILPLSLFCSFTAATTHISARSCRWRASIWFCHYQLVNYPANVLSTC